MAGQTGGQSLSSYMLSVIQIKDTLQPLILSFVERLASFWRLFWIYSGTSDKVSQPAINFAMSLNVK